MWYFPYLRMQKFLTVYTLVVVGTALLNLGLRFSPGHAGMSARDFAHLSDIRIDGWLYVLIAAFIAGGIATVLGLHLAAENDGHLEFAWTQPLSRDEVGLRIFGIDIIGLVIAQIITVFVMTVATDIWIGHPAVVFDGSVSGFVQQGPHGLTDAGPAVKGSLSGEIVRSLLAMTFPLSIYAWIAVLSASLKRNRGTVAALFWPAMLALGAAQAIPIKAIATIAQTIGYILPITIYSNTSDMPATIPDFSFGFLLAAVMLALALVQWRRLEA